MKLPFPFYRLKLCFDVERLVYEISQFPDSAWRPHPNNIPGNSFLPLVSTRGTLFDDFSPPMEPTKFLEKSPYLQQTLASLCTLIGRTRLMRLDARSDVPLHVDNKYYWRNRTRVHIPIITHPEVKFICGDTEVHMAAGEAWTFDNRRLHKVKNNSDVTRIHLAIDTWGTSEFWRLAEPNFGQSSIKKKIFDQKDKSEEKLQFLQKIRTSDDRHLFDETSEPERFRYRWNDDAFKEPEAYIRIYSNLKKQVSL